MKSTVSIAAIVRLRRAKVELGVGIDLGPASTAASAAYALGRRRLLFETMISASAFSSGRLFGGLES